MILNTLKNIQSTSVSHNPMINKQVLLTNQQLPPITQFAQACFPPKAIAHAHQHEDLIEVFLIQSGEGIMTVNGKDHRLTAGSCICIEPTEQHELKNTSDTETMVVTYFSVVTQQAK